MEGSLVKKIKLLFVPFLFSAVAFCGAYTFLNWLLLIDLEWFAIKDIYVSFGGPIVLSALISWVLLRPRVKFLNLKSSRGNYNDLYCAVMWLGIFVPTLIAQGYIVKASGKLTVVDHVSELAARKPTKYCKIRRYYVDKNRIGISTATDVSGRNNEHFNMNLFVVVPIFDVASDTITSKYSALLGLRYSRTESNRLSQSKKEEVFKQFAYSCQYRFDHQNLNNFVYLDKVAHSDDEDGFEQAIKNNPTLANGTKLVFKAVNEPFEHHNGDGFGWIFKSLGLISTIFLVMISIPAFDMEALKRYEDAGTPVVQIEEFKGYLKYLVPQKQYLVTGLLIYANVLIFLAMFFSGLGFMSFKAADLLRWGADFGPLTMHGEWWRLLSSMFLHGGLLHIIGNMYGLIFAGIFLEPLMGRAKFLTAYLLTGLISSYVSIWWHPETMSVGASGAIFGLYGAFLTLLLTKTFTPKFAAAFLIFTSLFVGFNLVMGLIGEDVDNAAHLGGLISGLIIGLLIRVTLEKVPADVPMKRLRKSGDETF